MKLGDGAESDGTKRKKVKLSKLFFPIFLLRLFHLCDKNELFRSLTIIC